MKIMLKRYDKNYLLVTGGILFFSTLLLYLLVVFFFPKELDNLSRNRITNNFYYFAFVAVLVAPILEELTFRTLFLKNKFFPLLFFIGTAIYIFITANYYLYALYFLILYLFFYKKDTVLIFISNACLFSLVHYKSTDFVSIYTILPMFFQFSLGLMLIWVVVNFGLLKSIIAHLCFNLFIVSILAIKIQFPDSKNHKIIYNGYAMHWVKLPIFNNKDNMISLSSEYEVEAVNIDLDKFYKIYSKDSKMIKITSDNEFNVFEIKIERIDNKATTIDAKLIEDLFIKAGLVER